MNNSVNLGYMDLSSLRLKNIFNNIFQKQFLEIQCLLSDLSNYSNKVNKIIDKINSIIIRIDMSVNSELNTHLNRINNYMDMMDISPIDINYDNYISIPKIKNDGINYNICFKDESGNKILINSFNRNRTINELINFYLIKKGEHFLVDNYDNYYNFKFNGRLLNNRKNMRFIDSGLFDDCVINVSEKKIIKFNKI